MAAAARTAAARAPTLALALAPIFPEPPVSLAEAPVAVEVLSLLPPFPPLPLPLPLPLPPLPEPPEPALDLTPLSFPTRTLFTVRGDGLSPHFCVTCTSGLSEDWMPLLVTSWNWPLFVY